MWEQTSNVNAYYSSSAPQCWHLWWQHWFLINHWVCLGDWSCQCLKWCDSFTACCHSTVMLNITLTICFAFKFSVEYINIVSPLTWSLLLHICDIKSATFSSDILTVCCLFHVELTDTHVPPKINYINKYWFWVIQYGIVCYQYNICCYLRLANSQLSRVNSFNIEGLHF